VIAGYKEVMIFAGFQTAIQPVVNARSRPLTSLFYAIMTRWNQLAILA